MAKIGICAELTQDDRAWLAEQLAGQDFAFVSPDAANDCELVFGNPDPLRLDGASLRWLQLESTGFAEYLPLTRRHPDLQITNLAGFFAEPVAETLLAGVLALLRGVNVLVRLQDTANWQGATLRPGLRLLCGATVTLIGRGAIMARLAALLQPFGCRILQFGRDHDPAELDRGLAASLIVAACVPDTPGTRGLIHEGRIASLGPDAIFANAGRGTLVDEKALVAALTTGRLGGAVLDVTQQEPLAADNPLWTCPRLLLTQHTGGGFAAELRGKAERFVANLSRWQSGQPLLGVIDPERGY